MFQKIINWFKTFTHKPEKLTIDEKFNVEKRDREKKLNSILDKINTKGMQSLSAHEKAFLENFNK